MSRYNVWYGVTIDVLSTIKDWRGGEKQHSSRGHREESPVVTFTGHSLVWVSLFFNRVQWVVLSPSWCSEGMLCHDPKDT